MGELLWVKRLSDAAVMALGGYTEDQMKEALQKANEIGDLALKGKYHNATNGVHDALRVGIKVRLLRRLTANIFPELVCNKTGRFSIRTMETSPRLRAGEITGITCEVVDQTCSRGVLGEDSGFTK